MFDASLPLALLILTFLSLLLGFPVFLTLAGGSIVFALIASLFNVFDASILFALPSRIFGVLTNELLIAIPLFVLMGTVLDKSKIAADLIQTMGRVLGGLPGGLGVSLCLVGALLAASTGIVGATVVAMGLIALPSMLERGYPPRFASGLVCASGSLGQIIPPSIVLVLLADQLGAVYGEAQRNVGNWTARPISVGDLFAGAILPGMLLVGFFIVYVVIFCLRNRVDLRPDPSAGPVGWRNLLSALAAPLCLLVAVLGSILGGIATPTEAAGLGACGALLLAAIRSAGETKLLILAGLASAIFAVLARFQDNIPYIVLVVFVALFLLGLAMAIIRLSQQAILHDVLKETLEISAMVYGILIGATCFALVFRGLDGDIVVAGFLNSLPGGETGALIFVMAVIFVLGFFLDVIEIITLAVPILATTLLQTVDPIWFGVMVAVNLQTSYLTPPFGFALFYLRGTAPPDVRAMDIYLGAAPFVGVQLLLLATLIAWPQLVLWLPGKLNP